MKQATFHSHTETLNRETEQTRPIPSKGPERGWGRGLGLLCVGASTLLDGRGRAAHRHSKGAAGSALLFKHTWVKSAHGSQNPIPHVW